MKVLSYLVILILPSIWSVAGQENSPTIEGTWGWKFIMPDGAVAHPILKISFDDGKLTGTSSFRGGGESPIINGILKRDQIRFQVIRQRDGQDITTTYTGKWSGKTIEGKIECDWAGHPQSYDWEARRVEGVEGQWRWAVAIGERNIQMQVRLKQDGAKLEGMIPVRGRGGRPGPPIKIKNGSIREDGEIYFETETGSPESRVVTKYQGKLSGDSIKGAIESTLRGISRKSDWVAERAY
jgi:hypothetical protein